MSSNDFNQSDYLYKKIGVSLDGVATLLDSLLLPSNLSILPLHKIPVGLLLPPHHPLLSENTIQLSFLNNIPLILPLQGNTILDDIYNYMQRTITELVLHRPNKFYSIEIFNTAVSENTAIIAPSIWGSIHPFLTFRPINWSYFSTYSFAFAKAPSPEVLSFVHDLRDVRNELAKTDTRYFKD